MRHCLAKRDQEWLGYVGGMLGQIVHRFVERSEAKLALQLGSNKSKRIALFTVFTVQCSAR